MERLTGIGVSPGVGVGRAVVLAQPAEVVPVSRCRPSAWSAKSQAIEQAREQSRRQLADIRARLAEGPARDLAPLFDAQLLMLEDPLLVGRAQQIVRDEHVNAAWALHRSHEELRRLFHGMEDPYLRDRETDVADVAGRLPHEPPASRGRPARSVEGDRRALHPDRRRAHARRFAAQLDWTRVQGFAVDAGSRTYHTAILARSLNVPAVVGLHDLSARVPAGTTIILDGTTGEVVIGAEGPELDTAQRRSERPRRRQSVVSSSRGR